MRRVPKAVGFKPDEAEQNKRSQDFAHIFECAAGDFTQLIALGVYLLHIQSLISGVYSGSAYQAIVCLLWRPNCPYLLRSKTATGKC
jgi:hypothetical protein